MKIIKRLNITSKGWHPVKTAPTWVQRKAGKLIRNDKAMNKLMDSEYVVMLKGKHYRYYMVWSHDPEQGGDYFYHLYKRPRGDNKKMRIGNIEIRLRRKKKNGNR